MTLWSSASGRVIGRPITTNPPGSGAQSISFSPDSARIAVPGVPGTVGHLGRGHRASGRRAARGRERRTSVTAIFARGGRSLIAADDSGSVTMVDVRTGRRIGRALSVGDVPATSLDLSSGERLLAVASFDGTVHVWDVRDRRALWLPARGRQEPGRRRGLQPRRTNPRELAPALGGRLGPERTAGDRRATRRLAGHRHGRVFQPRRPAARYRAGSMAARSCTTLRPGARLSGSTTARSSPRLRSSPTAS